MDEWINQNLGSILTALSILAAITTWAVAFARDRAARKMSHTADVIANLSINERLAEATFQMSKRINERAKIIVEDLDLEAERHVVDILDYYEYLCELYYREVLDKGTIIHLRGRLMRRTFEICEEYISAKRKAQQRPELYLRFEQLVTEKTQYAIQGAPADAKQGRG